MIAARQPRCNRAWLVHHFAGGADHALGLELGNRLAVLLPAPIDAATLVYGTGGPKSWFRRSSSSASSRWSCSVI